MWKNEIDSSGLLDQRLRTAAVAVKQSGCTTIDILKGNRHPSIQFACRPYFATLRFLPHSVFLLLLLSRAGHVSSQCSRDRKDGDQHTSQHDEPSKHTAAPLEIQLFHPNHPSPPRFMPCALDGAVCLIMSALVEVWNIIIESSAEPTRTCTRRTTWSALRLSLRFVGVRSLGRVLATLFGILTPSSASIERRRWSTELCSPPTETAGCTSACWRGSGREATAWCASRGGFLCTEEVTVVA